MSRIELLRRAVADLYHAEHPDRAEWADWIYEGHVVLVGNEAKSIASRFGGNLELAEAAGLLHDVADTVMKRERPDHEARSFEIARKLLTECGFSEDEITTVVDDAIAKHSCHGDVRPESLEGKVMASADGVVHMKSDFYSIAESRRKQFQTPQEIADWALPKIERDFNNKIAFEELREEVRPEYDRLKTHFSREGSGN